MYFYQFSNLNSCYIHVQQQSIKMHRKVSIIAACLLLAHVSQAAPIGQPGNHNGLQLRNLQTQEQNPSNPPPPSLAKLSEIDKEAVDKARSETKGKLDAVTAAGGNVDQTEISTAIKKAIADNLNADSKTTAKAIKTAVENLADQKLAEAKATKPPNPQRRDNPPNPAPELTGSDKSSVDRSKKESKAKLEAVTAAGGTVTDQEILAAIKKAVAENPKKDLGTAKAIKKSVESLADEKIAEAKDKKSSTPQRRQSFPALSEEAKSALEKTKTDGKARLDAVTAAGGTVSDREILLVIKKAAEENPKQDHSQAIKAGFIALTDQKLAEAKGSKSSRQRRDTPPSASPELTGSDKSAVDRSKKESKDKLEAVTAAGGTVTDQEILAAIKKAVAENPKKDLGTAKAIKKSVEALADEKVAEAKNHKSPNPQRRDTPSPSSVQLTDDQKAAVEKAKTDIKAKIDTLKAEGGSIDVSEISTAVKQAVANHVNSDPQTTGKAIKESIESLVDKKLADAKSKSSSQ